MSVTDAPSVRSVEMSFQYQNSSSISVQPALIITLRPTLLIELRLMAYSSLKPSRKPMRKLSKDRERRRRQLMGKISKLKRDGKMAAWRKAVLKRDEGTCQNCGRPGHHAHHIATRKRRPDLKYEVSNGLTTCFDCHTWIHDNPKAATEQGFLSDESYEKAKRAA